MGRKAFENPLISNARMREMFTTMVETRMLAKHLRRVSAGLGKSLEACWVATAIDLREGDLTTDSGAGPIPGYIRSSERHKSKVLRETLASAPVVGRLDAVEDPAERMWCAIGAAQALKSARTQGVVLGYVGSGDLSAAQWKRVLARAKDVPLILMVLPDGGDSATVAQWAGQSGVPGIPVDAADAVGLYRVAQESIVRARADGKAALIAGVRLPDKSDPVRVLGDQLVTKQVATAKWVTGIEGKFRKRLNATASRLH